VGWCQVLAGLSLTVRPFLPPTLPVGNKYNDGRSVAGPHVFEPPGFGSGSISQRHGFGSGSGSGSFYHQAKIVRKTLIPAALWLLFDFLSLKMM
jgi:hypothetical protein